MSDKDIYKKGKFILTEWEDVNYCEHSFEYNGEELTDYEVIDLLYQQHKEKEQLKQEIEKLKTSRPIEKCKEAKNMECINCLNINKCDYFKKGYK